MNDFKLCGIPGCDSFAVYGEMCAYHLEKQKAKVEHLKELAELRKEKQGQIINQVDESFYK